MTLAEMKKQIMLYREVKIEGWTITEDRGVYLATKERMIERGSAEYVYMHVLDVQKWNIAVIFASLDYLGRKLYTGERTVYTVFGKTFSDASGELRRMLADRDYVTCEVVY